MNVKKLMAGAVASVVAVSAMAVAASAYDATLGYADSSWSVQDWDTTVEVTGDGTYTVTSNFAPWEDADTGDEIPALANGAVVFVVDIKGLATDKNAGSGADGFEFADDDFAGKAAFAKAAGIDVSNIKVTVTDADGASTELDASGAYVGDLEGKGNIRIEIYNEYGAQDPAIDLNAIADAAQIAVTFTITGIDGSDAATGGEDAATGNDNASNGNTAASTGSDKTSADTGVEGVAVVAGLAIVAAGAVVVAKKRG